MNKHTATCPNGQIVKRNSATRVYKYVAVCFNVKKNQWQVLGWSSTLDLARRNADAMKNQVANYIKWNCYTGVYGDTPDCRVLEANAPTA